MLLTGKYNFCNYSNWGYLGDSEKTFGNVMQDAGYKTGFFGKLQLPFSFSKMSNWGFDKYAITVITEDMLPKLRYKSPVLIDNNGRVPDSVTLNKYGDDIFTGRILNFIDSNKNNPFFVYYSMSLAHAPFSPTPNDSAYANWNPDNSKSDTNFFHSMISYMDFKVGLILDKLAKTGLDKNTIVVFSGDNGTPFQIFYNVDTLENVEGKKRSTVERGTHVPLIAYWPSHIPKNQINDDLIDFTDFLPTFAEAAGNKNLSGYGTIDGLSFYSRLLGKENAFKPQLFMHYCAHPGFDFFKRWVRDKTYKLYDSLNSSSFKFYNIVKDEKEKTPLKDSQLTLEEKNIKARFKIILDSMPTWGDAPNLNNPFVNNITSSSATIGATILNQGSSQLIEKGSNIISGQDPILGEDRMHENAVKLGVFSEARTKLNSQTLYKYSVYAINANASHNTGYAIDSFYTLSAPPVSQPSYFKACVDSSAILLNWDKATFPSNDATLRGYAIFYSTDSIMSSQNPNGQSLSNVTTNARLLYFDTNRVSNNLKTSIHISSLDNNITYHFLLIPYTYNATTDSTCNYLTAGALSATLNYTMPLTLNSTNENPTCFNGKDGNITISAFNGTAPYNYSIGNNNYTQNSLFNNLSAGGYLLMVKDANGCLDSESIVLKSPDKIQLTLAVNNSDCTSDGRIIASAKEGIPPYMFSFNNGKFDTTSHFTDLSNGDYMIEVEDNNKCITSTDAIVKATTQNCTSGINIFPNPSNSVFKIEIGNDQIANSIIIKVYDQLGKLVYKEKSSQNASYTFGKSLNKGTYFVKIQSGDKAYKFKVLKN